MLGFGGTGLFVPAGNELLTLKFYFVVPFSFTDIVCLYVQLDDACIRSSKAPEIGGNLVLLYVWSWERLPVGRPSVTFRDWNSHNNALREATWAYKWDVVSKMTNDPDIMYIQYTNELDTLTPEQVTTVFTCITHVLLSMKT